MGRDVHSIAGKAMSPRLLIEAKKYDLPHFVTQRVVNAPDVKVVRAEVERTSSGPMRASFCRAA